MIIAPSASTNASKHDYKHIEVRPLTGALGAEIFNVKVNDLSPAEITEIKQAQADHGVVFFRDQNISIEEQEAFTLNFGDFGVDPYVPGIEGHPHVLRLVKEADEATGYVFGGAWHSDWSFQEAPPSFTILYGRDIPNYGGDTMFANLYQAYEMLSPEMQRVCESLNVIHSARLGYAPASAGIHSLYENMEVIANEDAMDIQVHPMVIKHPVTGKKLLFVTGAYSIGIEGMHQDEADALLNFLKSQIENPINTCRFRWEQGSIAMWDNRCALHLPMGDYHGVRREMYRTTVAGAKPIAAKSE